VKFGIVSLPQTLQDFPAALVLGTFGGLCGALYIYVNHNFNYAFRKKYLKSNVAKIIECCLLTFVTITCFYWAPELTRNNCIEKSELDPDRLEDVDNYLIQYYCDEGQFNPLASFAFNQQATVIRAMMNFGLTYQFTVMFILFVLWFAFTMITSGTAIPCGIFLPCIIVGQCLGQMYYITVNAIMGANPNLKPQSCSIIGAAAMLSASTRMTYSLAVIMLETTSNVDLFIPMIFALFVSYGVGSLFTRSLYTGTLRAKNIPVLEKHLPKCNRNITADVIMTSPVKTLKVVDKVQNILVAVQTSSFHGFPVMNSKDKPVGIISKNTLITLIEYNCWYDLQKEIRKKTIMKQ